MRSLMFLLAVMCGSVGSNFIFKGIDQAIDYYNKPVELSEVGNKIVKSLQNSPEDWTIKLNEHSTVYFMNKKINLCVGRGFFQATVYFYENNCCFIMTGLNSTDLKEINKLLDSVKLKIQERIISKF
jgi:hypothetical protein